MCLYVNIARFNLGIPFFTYLTFYNLTPEFTKIKLGGVGPADNGLSTN